MARTLKNDPKFKSYVKDVELLMPELNQLEINMLKKYYKLGIPPYQAVHEILEFTE